MHHRIAISFIVSTVLVSAPPAAVASDTALPSFEDVLSLREIRDVVIAPDGKQVVFAVRSADWVNNEFDTEFWLARAGEAPLQLTNTSGGSSRSARWSPDSQWLAFIAKRADKPQLYLIRARGGEAQAITDHTQGVSDFRWSPDGQHIAFLSEDENAGKDDREQRYGAFAVEDSEYIASHLWLVAVMPEPWPAAWERPCYKHGEDQGISTGDGIATTQDTDCPSLPKPERLTEGDAFTVDNFEWSPDGQDIVFERRDNADILASVSADISILNLASRSIRVLVDGPGFDGSPQWSPDGQWVLYATSAGDVESNFYRNGQLKKIARGGGEPIRLAANHDEEINDPRWTKEGIFFLSWHATKRYLYRLDVDNDRVEPLAYPAVDNISEVDFSRNGKNLALVGRTGTTLPEVFLGTTRSSKLRALSSMTAQLAAWPKGSSEVIAWDSTDGTRIEGVLHKPGNFDPTRQYPLLVMIHGGPTGISTPTVVSSYVYPVYHWVQKGALVLLPNYRGSAGYGEAFRSLNVRNLGVGDTWDVLSGVDYLVDQGFVDSDRMGAMGWSQGGYISAFLTTNTNRFKAISVGAGISNWMTYYVNTDIHPFTRQYLKATPWSDPDIYAKTSPITNVNQATTPTLIQHGEFDRRVPTPNAYELYQGLQDTGVEARLIIYRGFGHGISKPRELLAAVWHNWQWFQRHIWGETVTLPGLSEGSVP